MGGQAEVRPRLSEPKANSIPAAFCFAAEATRASFRELPPSFFADAGALRRARLPQAGNMLQFAFASSDPRLAARRHPCGSIGILRRARYRSSLAGIVGPIDGLRNALVRDVFSRRRSLHTENNRCKTAVRFCP